VFTCCSDRPRSAEGLPPGTQRTENRLAARSRFPEAHYYQGLVYLHQSAFEPAAQEFRAELQLRPAEPSRLIILGTPCWSKVTPRTCALFRDVIKAPPATNQPISNSAALSCSRETPPEQSSLETARKLVPDHDATYFHSPAYRRAGRTGECSRRSLPFKNLLSRTAKEESLKWKP
jgi:hypothetical protein